MANTLGFLVTSVWSVPFFHDDMWMARSGYVPYRNFSCDPILLTDGSHLFSLQTRN